MALKSSKTCYGRMAVLMHWFVAIAILVLIPLGFRMSATTDMVLKAGLLKAHAAIGLMVFAITIARIVWWWFADRKPEDLPGTPKLQSRVAHLTHTALNLIILVMAISGIRMMVLINNGLGGSDQMFGPMKAHGVAAFLLIMMLTFHVAAALYHQFILKDKLFARIGIGRMPAV
ncbi:cytochrome b/b6 domain-containing protein [Microvirga sp. W0021]|uniref:Cytochrome b/b6 domain-containing protein n=1 Tax=Hohaiivirga grylli TaxID=3133970 RepID=A0ABV0BFA2_9HYPH